MFRRSKICAFLLLLIAFGLVAGPAEAGFWSAMKNFGKKLADGVADTMEGIGKALTFPAKGLYQAGKTIAEATSDSISALQKASKGRKSNSFVNKIKRDHYVIARHFALTGRERGERAIYRFRVRQPGTVYVRAKWDAPGRGTQRLALILNGPGQVGYYERIDGDSPLGFKFDVTPEILKRGDEWRVSIVDFSTSARPADGRVVIIAPGRAAARPAVRPARPSRPTRPARPARPARPSLRPARPAARPASSVEARLAAMEARIRRLEAEVQRLRR